MNARFNPTLVISTLLCVLGVGYFVILQNIGWNRHFLGILLVATLGGAAISFTGAIARVKAAILYPLVFTGLCIAFNLMAAAVAVLVFWWIAYSIGALFDRIFRVSPSLARSPGITRLASGYIILMLILTALAYTPFNTLPMFFIMFGPPCLFAGLSHFRNSKSSNLEVILLTSESRIAWLHSFAFNVILVLLFICALQPDIGGDSINAYRSKLLELREFGKFTYNPEKTTIGLIPNSGVWAQSFVVILSDNYEAAKLINFSKLVVSAFVINSLISNLSLNCDIGYNYSGYAISAALLSTPIFIYTSSQGFYDNSVYLVSAIFIHMVVSIRQEMGQNLIQSSTLIGMTGGLIILTKLTSVFVAPAFALFYLTATHRLEARKSSYFGWIISASTSALIIASFTIFVFTQTGNPIFPFYNSFFDSPYFGANNIQGPHTGYLSWKLFWDMTFNTATFSQVGSRNGQLGLIGILLLCNFIMLLRLRSDKARKARTLAALTLACFIIGAVFIGFFQNSARYVIVIMPFLALGLLQVSQWFKPWQFTLFLSVYTACNLYLLPQFGFGRISLTGAMPSNHKQVILESRPARLVADKLISDYGYSGRAFFFGSNGGYYGRVFENSWYDHASRLALRKFDCTKEESATRFLSLRKLDAVVVTATGRKYLDRFKPECYSFLENLSEEEIYIGSALIYTMPEFISHDKKSEFKHEPIVSNKPLLKATGVTSVAIDLNVACEGKVNMRLVSKLTDGVWEKVIFLPLSCQGGTDKIETRLDELNPDTTSILTFHFGKDSAITAVTGAVYWR